MLIAFTTVFLSGCLKKGEDDPLISFRTRKARVVGNWTMTSGKRTTNQGLFYSEEFTYTKDAFSAITTEPHGSYESKGYASFTIKFNRDGTVEELRSLYYNPNTTILKGTWNFTSGIGRAKKKEQVLIHYENLTGIVDILYDIRELRNKKLVLCREFGVENINTKEEFTFEQ